MTFYLIAAEDGISDETPGDHPDGPVDGLQVQGYGAPFHAVTPRFTEPMVVARGESVHLHVADHRALFPFESWHGVALLVEDASGAVLRDAGGEEYRLAYGAARSYGDDANWTDLRASVDASGPLPDVGTGVVIPAGHRIVVRYGLQVSGEYSPPPSPPSAGLYEAWATAVKASSIPGATFRADDAGTWLRITRAT